MQNTHFAGSALHVAELAQRTGVTAATIRHYARVGMLRPSRDSQNGYRCFSTHDVNRVVFVRRAQALGLTRARALTWSETARLTREALDEVAGA